MMVAQSAFWVGLLYDEAALAAAEALLRGATWEDAVALASRCAAPGAGGTVARAAPCATWREMRSSIARDGLRARARRNAAGLDESVYLAPLEAIVAGEPTQAEHWLARYHQAWQGDVSRIFAEGRDLKDGSEAFACSSPYLAGN